MIFSERPSLTAVRDSKQLWATLELSCSSIKIHICLSSSKELRSACFLFWWYFITLWLDFLGKIVPGTSSRWAGGGAALHSHASKGGIIWTPTLQQNVNIPVRLQPEPEPERKSSFSEKKSSSPNHNGDTTGEEEPSQVASKKLRHPDKMTNFYLICFSWHKPDPAWTRRDGHNHKHICWQRWRPNLRGRNLDLFLTSVG